MERPPLILLVNEDGTPKLAELRMRESATPGRMKVALTSTVTNGVAIRQPDGELQVMTAPEGVGEFGLCDEFRLEMN